MKTIFKHTGLLLMQLLLIYFFTLNLIGCGEKEISDEFTESENEILAQFLDSIAYKDYNDSLYKSTNPMLVPDSTNFRIPKPWLIDLYKRKYPEDEHLLKNLIEINKKKYFLNKNNFHKIIGLEFMSDSEAAYYYNRKNKDSLGMGFYGIEFSRPYADKKTNKAVIYMRKFSEDWEEVNYLWLKKENGIWIKYDIIVPNDWP